MFLEDLESVVVLQGTPVLHHLSAVAGMCSCAFHYMLLHNYTYVYRYSQCELLHVCFVPFAEACSTGVAEVLLALSSNFCREAREVSTDENGVVGAFTSATDGSSLWGAVRSWEERLGQRVEKELHSVSHIRGLSEEELEAVVTTATGDLCR